ncbi:MAG: hypothetical protein Q8S33_32105 [Myxococcales bacterium]|nr:hypothetical protein [Myxococcales bacterium]
MDESERLLDDLARLIEANGPDDFVFAPILTPDLVFRVKAPPFLHLGSALVGLGGLVAAANLTPWPLALVALTPLAWFVDRDVCSAEGCGTTLSQGVARCPACGGDVVGRVRRQREHADAERAFLEQQGGVASAARDVVKDLLSNARKPE